MADLFSRGPSYTRMCFSLSKILCILSEVGAERNDPDMVDILPQFLTVIGVRHPPKRFATLRVPPVYPVSRWTPHR